MAKKILPTSIVFFMLIQLLGGSIISAVAAPMAQEPAPSDQGLAPLMVPEGEIVPDQYIIVLKPEIDVSINSISIQSAIEAVGGKILFMYGGALNGYSAVIPEGALDWVRSDPAVEYVAKDGIAYLTDEDVPGDGEVGLDTTQTGATWGIDRVDQRNLPLNSKYIYDTTASGVHVYVIDSGILATHTQFGSRVSGGYDFIGDGRGTSDCNGHGTHVSGTIGGTTYGIAKSVYLHPVRVFGCTSTSPWSTIIAGVNWVYNNRVTPAVANMSLGGSTYAPMDTAVTNLIANKVTAVVSAGNSGINACNVSPARVPAAITVGATTSTDARSVHSTWSSNYGTCLDLFAPGSSILSAGITSNTATATKSGTSMASPHVTGAAALYLKFFPAYTPASVASFITSTATTGKVTNPGTGSPNKLLYTRVAIPVHYSPSGLITDSTPTYKWYKVDGATQYSYQLYNGSTLKYTMTVSSSVCGTSTCSHTPSTVLAKSDSYKWRIRSYVDGAWKTFSPYKYFQVTGPAVNFYNSFNSESAGWAVKAGGPWYSGSSYLYSAGTANKWSSVYKSTSRAYANFDYWAWMKRISSPNLANCIYIRMGKNVDASDNDWYPGYAFCYSNNEKYEIFRQNTNGSFTWIQPWTTATAVNTNTWNKLRVIAVGPYINFFINSTLVKTFSDSYFSMGYVGLGFFAATDQYQVDSAKLTVLDSLYALPDTAVDAAQEALNEQAWLDVLNCTPEYSFTK